MTHRILFLAFVSSFAFLLPACVVTPGGKSSGNLYVECASVSNCSSPATRCQYFAATWASGTASDSLCTVACANDSYCAAGWNGQAGFCAPIAFLGNDMQTCIPRCYTSTDCPSTMACIDASQLSTGKSVPYGTRICVPAGSSTTLPAAKAYATCSALADCDPSLTRCEAVQGYSTALASYVTRDICTKACAKDSDCPTSNDGELGYCSQGGAVSNMQVCVERCHTKADCAYGFYCADAKTPGVPTGVTICLPE